MSEPNPTVILIAASAYYDAKLKEYQAACWLGLPNEIAAAFANMHSALDALLDAHLTSISTIKAQASH